MIRKPMKKSAGKRFPKPIGKQTAQSQFVIWQQQTRAQ